MGNHELYKLVKSFREQIHFMAGYWMVLGTLGLAATGGLCLVEVPKLRFGIDPESLGAIAFFAVAGCLCTSLGLCIAYKSLTAIYVGMIASYALMPLSAAVNIWTILILFTNVGLAHRIIYTARKLTANGIPLTARPKDIQIPISLHFPKDG